MDTPKGPDAEVGEQLIGGNNTRRRAEVRAGLRIDTDQLGKLKKHLEEAKNITKQWREEMEGLAKAAGAAQQAMSGKSGTGTPRAAGTDTSKPVNSSQGQTATAATPPAGGGGGVGGFLSRAGGGGGKALGVAAIAKTLGDTLKPLVQSMDARIDRGISYATSADRLNLLTQQMTGQSQMQVMQNMRKPLTEYRLGANGVNALMQFQAATGVTANANLARSIEALRMSSGFAKSTQDILTEQQQLMNPEVANRMFFMMGSSAFNIGGGMKDPLETRQDIVQRLGLDNPAIARSALLPGSVTRARMADLGLGDEAQTAILQYAQQQIAYREKGGKGFYDPSDPRQRQMMGIEDNLATQQEETSRVQGAREEQFMIRQIDNMAALEKSNQALIKALGALEDKFSAVFGLRTSTRPFQRLAGSLGTPLMAAGAALTATGPGAAVGVPLMIAGGLMTAFGDPTNPEAEGGGVTAGSQGAGSSASDDTIMVPHGYGGERISLAALKSTPSFQKINPKFRERLLRMMRVNPNVGIGGGYRSPESQEQLFRSRYQPTSEKTDIFWNGTYWKHVSGAPAAPPGKSMHEIGLAVDMVGDIEWMNANAGKFGLKHFGGVNNEPWHVQPSDLPNSRSKYEKQGAAWGSDGRHDEEASMGAAEVVGHSTDSGSVVGTTVAIGLTGKTSAELLEAHRAAGLSRILAAGNTGWGAGTVGSGLSKRRTTAPTQNRRLTGDEVARYAYNAGFRGDDLAAVVAIAKRESGWQTGAYNPNRATQDDSYGLMQINMLGQMGVNRLRQFGISSNEDLYDPATNMRAAFSLYQARGGSLYDWGAYKGEENTYNTNIDEALRIVKDAGLYSGDPMIDIAYSPSKGGTNAQQSRSSTTHITSSPTINVAPVINFSGAPASPDLRNIAQTVSRMIKEEVDMIDLRTA